MSCSFLFIHVNQWATTDSPDTIPISQAYCLAYLQQHGFSGRILGDYKDQPLEPACLREALDELRPAVLGFSAYEENINRIRVWARYAKQLRPDLLIILGGPQATFMPAAALEQMDEVDILCRGEGEIVMLALARALAHQSSLKQVPGICFQEGGRPLETQPAPMPTDLDILPSPYLEEIVDVRGKSRVMLLSSRGCTSPCTFCYTTRASKKQVRFHSADRVIAEMDHLKTKGITDFWFADPNFAYSKKRLTELLQRIIADVPGIRFWCQSRYNLITDELLLLLKKAGARTIAFGLESADADVLKNIKKGLDPTALSRVIRRVQEKGIEVELFTLFGLPGETLSRAASTLTYVKANRVAIDGNSISQQLHLFFGTPISEEPAVHGIVPLPRTKPAYQSLCRDFETKTMSSEEIHQISLLWRLNRQDFQDNVRYGINLFEVAGFITANYRLLARWPEADLMLARSYMALEEFDAAFSCIGRLQEKFAHEPQVDQFLRSSFTGYRPKRRLTARQGCKVIYDCKGILNSQVIPATEAYYQEAVIGEGRLLPDFEEALKGLSSGRVTQADVLFPTDYVNRQLAGRRVLFQIHAHLVLEPVVYRNIAEVRDKPPRNIYRLHDLHGLRQHNEILYFKVLRDALIRDLTQDLTDVICLINLNQKLGFPEKTAALLAALPADDTLYEHLGRIFLANNLPDQAHSILTRIKNPTNNAKIHLAKALIKLERLQEAEQLALDVGLASEVQALDLRVGLAALLHQPLATYLQRMDDLLDLQVKMMAAS
jgi:anaerobic magnesium-protoporphyrin IX monomethyl ester cyclase